MFFSTIDKQVFHYNAAEVTAVRLTVANPQSDPGLKFENKASPTYSV